MTEAPIITSDIRSLIVPLNDYNLLLPGSVVAEVVPYQEPEPLPAPARTQDWILGLVTWRGLRVPLISVEVFGGEQELPIPALRARLIVTKGLTGDPRLPFYALVAQQIPRLQTVSDGMLESLEGESLDEVPGRAVLVAGEPAVIPDVEPMERALASTLFG